MKPIFEFIVEIPKSHNDEVVFASGLKLKFDTRYNQGQHVNRIGKVVAVPLKFESKIREGFIVLIDKNLVTYQVYNDTEINKSVFLVDVEKGWYRVAANMIYLYKENMEADWVCPSPFMFLAPIKNEIQTTESGLEHKATEDYKGNKPQYGTVEFLNEKAQEMGIQKGDTVYYKKDREYEFVVDGKLLYHMETDDVLAFVTEQVI